MVGGGAKLFLIKNWAIGIFLKCLVLTKIEATKENISQEN